MQLLSCFAVLLSFDFLVISAHPNNSTTVTDDNLSKDRGIDDFLAECGQLVEDEIYEEAIFCYTEALDQYPSVVSFYALRGSCFFYMNKLEKALSDFKIGMSKIPDSEEAELRYWNFDDVALLGKQLCNKKEIESAMWCFDLAIRGNTDQKLPFKLRASCNFGMERWQEVIDDLKIVLRTNPNEEECRLRYSLALHELGEDKEAVDAVIVLDDKKIAKLCEQLLFSKRKNLQEALRCYSKAIEKNSDNFRHYQSRGICFTELQMRNEAIIDFKRGLSLNRFDLSSWFKLIELLIDLGRSNEILEEIQFLSDPEIIWLKTNIHVSYPKITLLLWNELIRRNPSEISYYKLRADNNFTIGNYQMAAEDFRKCKESDPTDIKCQYLLVDALLACEKNDEARREMATSDYHSMSYLGHKCMREKRYKDAIHCYSEVVSKIYEKKTLHAANALLSMAYRNIGECHRELGNFDDAILNYKKSLSVYSNLEVQIALCGVLLDAGKCKEAQEAFNHFEGEIPESSLVFYEKISMAIHKRIAMECLA